MSAGGKREGAGRQPVDGVRRIKTSFTIAPSVSEFIESLTSDSKSRSDVFNETIQKLPTFKKWLAEKNSEK